MVRLKMTQHLHSFNVTIQPLLEATVFLQAGIRTYDGTPNDRLEANRLPAIRDRLS
jgi:hypothetical protein